MIRLTTRSTDINLRRLLIPLVIIAGVSGASLIMLLLFSRGDPKDILWPVGGLIAILVFLNPLRGVYLLALAIPLSGVFLLGDEVTIVRGITVLTVFAWLLRTLVTRDSMPPALSSPLFRAIFLFALFAFASLPT